MVIFLWLIFILLLGVIIFQLIVLALTVYFAFRGAPYAVTDDTTLTGIITAAKGKKGEKALDVGSGDGKIVIALAQAGFEAHGFEINPLLVLWSRHRIRRASLEKRAFIHLKDFWHEDFSKFDVIVLYQITYVMKRLEKKLRSEVKPGARVITNYFVLPTWKPKMKQGRVAVYEVTLSS